MMDLTKLAASLLMIAALTTTWARSISEHRQETMIVNDAENRDDSTKRYSNDEDDAETIIGGTGGERENGKYGENFPEKYAKSDEAENYLRERPRIVDKRRRSLRVNEDQLGAPFSAQRLEKMLEKAILKIITGDLSTADILLLKSLNYSLEEVLAIRERELGKKNHLPESSSLNSKILRDPRMDNDLHDDEGTLTERSRDDRLMDHDEEMSRRTTKSATTISARGSSSVGKSVEGDFDFDAYNRQAIYDYENGSNKISRQSDFEPNASMSVDNENRSSNDNVAIDVDDVIRTSFDRAMEPHVVFKIRYDDSEFDSSSNERFKQFTMERTARVPAHRGNIDRDRDSKKSIDSPISSTNESSSSSGINTTHSNSSNKTFQVSNVDGLSSIPIVHRLDNFATSHDDLNSEKNFDVQMSYNEKNPIVESNDNSSLDSASPIVRSIGSPTSKSEILERNDVDNEKIINNATHEDWRRKSVYEGLEWIEDDVYRVIPEALESPNYYDTSVNEMENDTIEDSRINGTRSFEIERTNENDDNDDHDNDHDDHDDNDENRNDTIGFQNENPENEAQTEIEGGYTSMRNSPNVNLSTYQQLALAHRRDGNVTSPSDSQGQKAIEDIKLKVLAMTGRFNLSSNGNQVQRERLTMFSPICQTPRNTDAEAWSDQYSMNMNFQLNLTSGDHVVAAKVRIYALPQENITVTAVGAAEDEDEEEKKIRISIYFYTKSLKKHRSKKRLIDSVVISLSTQGSHWALDVRQALRFWRQNLRNSHGMSNNHGLVIQVEDQDGRSLKPSQYIQQDSCHTSELDDDEKAYQRAPALFVQACSRYVRVVNGEPVTYVNCSSKSSRNGRH